MGFEKIDLHYVRESRAAEVAGNEAFGKSAMRTRERELAVINASDIALVALRYR